MKKVILFSTAVSILMVLVVLFAQVSAEPGKLDPTFGDDGVALVDFGELDDEVNALFLQRDGRILASGWVDVWPGDFGTIRLLPDGSLDPSFGASGKVTTAFSDNPANVDAAWSVTAAPNGRIYVSGETCDDNYIVCDFATVAYNADGTLDESFASAGKSVVGPGTDTAYAWPRRDILQSDGKLIVAGVALNGGESVDIALRRYNTDGSLDNTFGTNGFVVQDFDNENNYPQDLTALPGGKILVAGGFGEPTEDPFLYLSGISYMALFNGNGSLDTTFGGGDGLVTWDYMGTESINKGVTFGSDGMIYVLGEILSETGGVGDCTLRRFSSTGVPDTAFGSDSWVIIESDTDDACWDLRETPDNKLAFTGVAFPLPPESQLQSAGRAAYGRRAPSLNAIQAEDTEMTMIGRYNRDGSPDETFGPDGLVLTQVFPTGSAAYGLLVQDDGKLVTSSREFHLEDRDKDMGVIRFLGDGPAAQVFAPAVMGSPE